MSHFYQKPLRVPRFRIAHSSRDNDKSSVGRDYRSRVFKNFCPFGQYVPYSLRPRVSLISFLSFSFLLRSERFCRTVGTLFTRFRFGRVLFRARRPTANKTNRASGVPPNYSSDGGVLTRSKDLTRGSRKSGDRTAKGRRVRHPAARPTTESLGRPSRAPNAATRFSSDDATPKPTRSKRDRRTFGGIAFPLLSFENMAIYEYRRNTWMCTLVCNNYYSKYVEKKKQKNASI